MLARGVDERRRHAVDPREEVVDKTAAVGPAAGQAVGLVL